MLYIYSYFIKKVLTYMCIVQCAYDNLVSKEVKLLGKA